MKALRVPFLLLLIFNVIAALFVALNLLGRRMPWDEPGESARLGRQLAPEQIRLVTTPAVPASSPRAAASAPVAGLLCSIVSGLTQDEAQQLEGQAQEYAQRLEMSISARVSGISAPSYWVHIPPSGGKEGATRRAEILTRAGLTDLIIIRDPGPNQFAISLGLFRSEEAARRLFDQLRKRNVINVRLTVRDNTGNKARVELKGPDQILDAMVSDFISTHSHARRSDSCHAA
ncbi:MAG: hypothetical protein CGU28_00715 [Candidatus Dactylopiibacterium carminicum]|nr:MAG: hypothetical protein CGU28_00715 [Candidatus Dactylopiibacterium carminicum]